MTIIKLWAEFSASQKWKYFLNFSQGAEVTYFGWVSGGFLDCEPEPKSDEIPKFQFAGGV